MLTVDQLRMLLQRLYAKEPRIVSYGRFSSWRINNMILRVQEMISAHGVPLEG